LCFAANFSCYQNTEYFKFGPSFLAVD